MKNFIKDYALIVKNSFHQAFNGKESLEIVIWIWGGLAYLLSLFINKIKFLQSTLSFRQLL
jgi:hypothetical protein